MIVPSAISLTEKISQGKIRTRAFLASLLQVKNLAVSQYFYSWIFDKFKFDNSTLDIDSSAMMQYGVKDRVKIGIHGIVISPFIGIRY